MQQKRNIGIVRVQKKVRDQTRDFDQTIGKISVIYSNFNDYDNIWR